MRFFETNHGQSEGDSAHSAISSAIESGGDIFVPSQLHPIMKLARRKQPYNVNALRYDDFFDFKKLSQSIRLLSIKTTDAGDSFKWTEMMELKVVKDKPTQIFFKSSHNIHSEYSSITLKRKLDNLKDMQLSILNSEPIKISKEKYNDLMALCNGATPVIRILEHAQFYKNLPHDG